MPPRLLYALGGKKINNESGFTPPPIPRKLWYKLGLDTPLCLTLNIDSKSHPLSAWVLQAPASNPKDLAVLQIPLEEPVLEPMIPVKPHLFLFLSRLYISVASLPCEGS